MDPTIPVTNYDRIYGEALCMRAWAYFTAVNIYGKIPYIPDSLQSIDEIRNYVNSSGKYVDSVYVDYGVDGYHNVDTVLNKEVVLDKQLMDLDIVLDIFIDQLENDVKIVGVNHALNNYDFTWEITVWNTWAWHALLGKMYMYQGDLARAVKHFEKIIYNSTEDRRYQLDGSFSRGNWKSIFTSPQTTEHLLTIWFDDEYFQNNGLQDLFETRAPHKYMLKPTPSAIQLFESAGDQYRGVGSAYSFVKGGNYDDQMSYSQVQEVARLRASRNPRKAEALIDGYDTTIYKYSIDKGTYDEDACFSIYRASEIHLDLAEIYTYWAFEDNYGLRTFTLNALNILNDGSNYTVVAGRPQLGVRGRVGLRAISLNSLPNGNLPGKQHYLDQQILDERGRELAYEGKRFYDIMRVSKRLNNPSLLANKVAAKYPYSMRNKIRTYLMNENNWYIHYFD
jgi:tetratricopeptide (TPR) repeat protein